MENVHATIMVMVDRCIKLIKDYENKLINIEEMRESDNRAGDHSFSMKYDTSEENIIEFIGELKKLQALFI